MANKTIPDLTAAVSMATGDLFEICADPAGTPARKKVTKAIVQAPDFTSALFVIRDHLPYICPHGFGATPSKYFSALVCIADDATSGITTGMEIPLVGFLTDQGGGSINVTLDYADPINVTVSAPALYLGNEGSFNFPAPNANGYTQFGDLNNFRVRVYAWK